MKYRFEEQQQLVFKLFDVDTTMANQRATFQLDSQDYIGEMKCQLSQIMGGRASTFQGNVVRGWWRCAGAWTGLAA